MSLLISQFPSAINDNIFTTNEIKKIFYHFMPLRWCTNFVNSDQNVQQVSTKVLCTYMVQQEAQIDTHRKRVCESNKKQQQKIPFNKSTGGKQKKYNNFTHKNNNKDSKKISKIIQQC